MQPPELKEELDYAPPPVVVQSQIMKPKLLQKVEFELFEEKEDAGIQARVEVNEQESTVSTFEARPK